MSSILSHEFVPIWIPATSDNKELIVTPALNVDPLFANPPILRRRFRSQQSYIDSFFTSNPELDFPSQRKNLHGDRAID